MVLSIGATMGALLAGAALVAPAVASSASPPAARAAAPTDAAPRATAQASPEVTPAGLVTHSSLSSDADPGSSGVSTDASRRTVTARSTVSSAPGGSAGSFTYLITNTNGSPARFNPCAAVHYVTNLAEAPAGAASTVSTVLSRITAATGVSFVFDGPTAEVPSTTRGAYQPTRYGSRWAPVVIAWAKASQSNLLPGGNVIGEGGSTWVAYSGGPKVFVTGEVVIDADRTATMDSGFGPGASVGGLLLHELGHVMGLGHTQDPNQVMYPALLRVASAQYGAGDLAGLGHLGRTAGCLTTPNP